MEIILRDDKILENDKKKWNDFLDRELPVYSKQEISQIHQRMKAPADLRLL